MSAIKTNNIKSLDGTVSVAVKALGNMSADYVDNAAAIAGGLVVGSFYCNTTDDKVTEVK